MTDVQAAIEYIFPLVYEFRKERSPEDIQAMKKRRVANGVEEYIYESNQNEEDSASDSTAWDD